jgi:4-methylaminobutanoate oxidase (formaldehyde-forming)
VSFVVDDPEPMLWGGELVLRDGVPVGQVTSAAWGETVGGCVGLAYVADPAGVTSREWASSGGFTVNVGGSVRPVTVSLRAPYDPDNARVRT